MTSRHCIESNETSLSLIPFSQKIPCFRRVCFNFHIPGGRFIEGGVLIKEVLYLPKWSEINTILKGIKSLYF